MEHVRQMPGRIVGRTRRPRRPAGLHADAAGARAAHPPRQGDLEHLHEPGPAGDGRDDLHGAAGRGGPGAGGRARAWRARAELVAALTRVQGVRAAFGGAALPRGGAACSTGRSAPVLEALARRGIVGGFDLGALPGTRPRAARVRHRDARPAPTSSLRAALCATFCAAARPADSA